MDRDREADGSSCRGSPPMLGLAALVGGAREAGAQTVREVFEKVAPSVVVIKARGHDVTAGGQSRFEETGSGVLVTRGRQGDDGGPRRAQHGPDRRGVPRRRDGAGARRVLRAGRRSLAPAARPGARRARRSPRWPIPTRCAIGDPVVIVGAPYGLAYSLSAGSSARGGRPTPCTRRCRSPSSSRRRRRSTPATPAGPCSR